MASTEVGRSLFLALGGGPAMTDTMAAAGPRPQQAAPPFFSILFQTHEQRAAAERATQPECFRDLNLDQVVEAITGRDEYDIKRFFYLTLFDRDALVYRQEVFRDLDDPRTYAAVSGFLETMRRMRARLDQAARLFDRRQREIWLLESLALYCDAVASLHEGLAEAGLKSRGLSSLRDYVRNYASSEKFATMAAAVARVQAELGTIQYCMHIDGAHVTVTPYEGEADYSEKVLATFARFREGASKDYRVTFRDDVFEPRVLDGLAHLYPGVFEALSGLLTRHGDFLDERLALFDREVRFYTAYMAFARKLREAGLHLTLPAFSEGVKETHARQAYDIALATSLLSEGKTVVFNDFSLSPPEQVLVVTGPNQGGKTTFARMFGQLHYLAALGVPVPAAEARLFLARAVYTHFEREESLETLRGKLEDELFRLHQILTHLDGDSIVIMNESFSSTTLNDALYLGKAALGRVLDAGALGVCVTFVDELSSLGPGTVSMMSSVDPEDPSVRTFRIVRRPADGVAHAVAMARKYGLSYETLRRSLDQ
jgi:DNA mismatch repair protein MutS